MPTLSHITVDTPHRRLDLTAPADAPVADLLATLVRAGGDRLVDDGAATGWVVRLADGAPLSAERSLQDQGVRDGAVLHLVPASQAWPELEWDAISDAVAAARRTDRLWSEAFTSTTGLVAAWLTSLAALAVIVTAPDVVPITAGVAAVLCGTAILLARVAGDAPSATRLAGLAMPFAYAGALLAGGRVGPDDAVRAGIITAILAAAVALAVGSFSAAEVALGVTAVAGSIGAATLRVVPATSIAGCALAIIALGVGATPTLAARLTRLDTWYAEGVDGLAAAVRRAHAVAAGLIAASGLIGVTAAGVLVRSGWGRALAVAAAAVLALRVRAWTAVPCRLLALGAAFVIMAPVVAWAVRTGAAPTGLAAIIALAAAGAALAGTPHLRRRVLAGPGRVLEVTALAAVLPLLCGVLDLYDRAASAH